MKINTDKLVSYLKTIYNVWDFPVISKTKSLFAWIGLITGIYLIIFFMTIRPQEVQNSQAIVDSLKEDLMTNENTIKDINDQNTKLLEQNVVLEKKLEKIQRDFENKKKKYEKEIARLNNLSNKQLSKLFADTFEEI